MWTIANWNERFENNRTRDLKHLGWVPIPNKHDGDGFTELMSHKDGAAHYGVWCLLLQVASKCDPRGTLVRDGARPHTAATLARMIRVPEPVVRTAIERLVRDIGWIVTTDSESTCTIPQDGAGIPQETDATLRKSAYGMEWNGTEGKRTERTEGNGKDCSEPDKQASEPACIAAFPIVGSEAGWIMPQALFDSLAGTFSALDVAAEFLQARAWLQCNPQKRKTARGMPKFLFSWLERSQNRRGGSAPTKRPEPVFAPGDIEF